MRPCAVPSGERQQTDGGILLSSLLGKAVDYEVSTGNVKVNLPGLNWGGESERKELRQSCLLSEAALKLLGATFTSQRLKKKKKNAGREEEE